MGGGGGGGVWGGGRKTSVVLFHAQYIRDVLTLTYNFYLSRWRNLSLWRLGFG